MVYLQEVFQHEDQGGNPIDTYTSFSTYYDLVMQDYSWAEIFLKKVRERVDRKGANVLELGCGTGRILKELADSQASLYGIDLSRGMLEQAKKRLPQATLIEDDIRSFSLTERFDLILCLFDTINHLKRLEDWELTFRQVREHLTSNGSFLLDMNSPQRLGRLSLFPPLVRSFEETGTMIMRVVEERLETDGSGRFHFDTTIYAPVDADLFRREHLKIEEYAPPAHKVLELLASLFSVVRTFDEDGHEVGTMLTLEQAREGRLFFLCSP